MCQCCALYFYPPIPITFLPFLVCTYVCSSIQLLLALDTICFFSFSYWVREGCRLAVLYGREDVFVLFMGWMDGWMESVGGLWLSCRAWGGSRWRDGEAMGQWRLKQTGQVHLAGMPAYVTAPFVFFFFGMYNLCLLLIYVSFKQSHNDGMGVHHRRMMCQPHSLGFRVLTALT